MLVLIADDHAITRLGLRTLVTESFLGAQVEEASHGDEVLEKLPTQAWDLVVLDVIMPGTDPVRLVRQVREQRPQTPILMLTAAQEPQYAIETMRAGANGLIHKHRLAADLVAAIDAVLSGVPYLDPETAAEVARYRPEATPHETLSPRERAVFVGLARGLAVKEVAADLEISDKTVSTYLARIREKTGLSSPVDIARYAMKHGLVD